MNKSQKDFAHSQIHAVSSSPKQKCKNNLDNNLRYCQDGTVRHDEGSILGCDARKCLPYAGP